METPEQTALEVAEGHVQRALLLIVEREVALPEAIELAYRAELDALRALGLPGALDEARADLIQAFAALREAPEAERRARASALIHILIGLHLAIVEAKWAPLRRDMKLTKRKA